jgi:uncharacterized protein YndB with AHSA1/START domain
MQLNPVSGFVARSPDRCWRAFTDATLLPAWVPDVRKVRVVRRYPDGLAHEVLFELGASRTYSLVYSYDQETRTVRWEPGAGKRDAVRGFARIDTWDGGTRMTYATGAQHEDARSMIAAFARWIEAARPTYIALRA